MSTVSTALPPPTRIAHLIVPSRERRVSITSGNANSACSASQLRKLFDRLVMLIDGPKLKDYAKSYTMKDMLRYSVFLMSLLLKDEETQVNGAIILENLDNYPIFALNSMKGMGPQA